MERATRSAKNCIRFLAAGAAVLAVGLRGGSEIGFQLVRSFGFPNGMGDSASGGVIQGSDGRFFGTTVYGGTTGSGVVYALQADGSGYTVLHHFQGTPSDGAQSVAVLAEDAGVLYGMTASGGSANGGVVFRLNADGSG